MAKIYSFTIDTTLMLLAMVALQRINEMHPPPRYLCSPSRISHWEAGETTTIMLSVYGYEWNRPMSDKALIRVG